MTTLAFLLFIFALLSSLTDRYDAVDGQISLEEATHSFSLHDIISLSQSKNAPTGNFSNRSTGHSSLNKDLWSSSSPVVEPSAEGIIAFIYFS